MGYSERVDGEIMFHPPLTWKQIKESGFWRDPEMERRGNWRERYQRNLRLELTEKVAETDTGLTKVVEAFRLVPTEKDEQSAGRLMTDLKEFVAKYGEGRSFSGEIEVQGEENGDVWKARVERGETVEIRAVLVWGFEELVAQRDEATRLLQQLSLGSIHSHSQESEVFVSGCLGCRVEAFLTQEPQGVRDRGNRL